MGSESRKNARLVEAMVILFVAGTAILAGWRIVDARNSPQVANVVEDSNKDCREAEHFCSTQCSGQDDECVETCMVEFGCVVHL